MNKQYFSEIHRILQTVEETQAEAMDQLSARMAEAIRPIGTCTYSGAATPGSWRRSCSTGPGDWL